LRWPAGYCSLYGVRDGYGSPILFFVLCVIEVTLGFDEGGKVPLRIEEEGELRACMETVALHRVRIPYQRLATNLIIARYSHSGA